MCKYRFRKHGTQLLLMGIPFSHTSYSENDEEQQKQVKQQHQKEQIPN